MVIRLVLWQLGKTAAAWLTSCGHGYIVQWQELGLCPTLDVAYP